MRTYKNKQQHKYYLKHRKHISLMNKRWYYKHHASRIKQIHEYRRTHHAHCLRQQRQYSHKYKLAHMSGKELIRKVEKELVAKHELSFCYLGSEKAVNEEMAKMNRESSKYFPKPRFV